MMKTKMQFAVSPHAGNLGDALRDWVASATTNATPVFAIVDGSMFESHVLTSLMAANHPAIAPVLSDTPLESYGVHGPLLCDVGEASLRLLGKLLRLSNQKPALSFVKPRADVATLRDALRWLAVAQTGEEVRLYCRYADTRVLPGLLEALNPPQRQVLAGAIEQWRWIARDGGALEDRIFPESPPEDTALPAGALQLDDSQYAGLLRHAEPDMVCQLLIERLPELLPAGLSGPVHRRIAAIVDRARTRGIDELNDLFQYAIVALSTYDDFAQHPCLRDAWEAYGKNGSSFGAFVESWPEDVWQELQGAARSRPENESV